MIVMEIDLTITMIYLQLETRITLQKPFETDFSTVIGNAKLRTSFILCWVTQGSRPRCCPRHLILHSNIFFYLKLFAIIILSWNLLECIPRYLLELSDPFNKNENSVSPILIEKNFKQNFTFVFWKWGLFLRKREIQFFQLNLDRDYRNHFLNFM